MITLTDGILQEMAGCIVKAVDPEEIIVLAQALREGRRIYARS